MGVFFVLPMGRKGDKMKPEYLQSAEEVLCSQGQLIPGPYRGGGSCAPVEARPQPPAGGQENQQFPAFLQQLKDPMLLILLAAAAVSAVTSILSPKAAFTEVFIILVVVLLNAVLGVVQRARPRRPSGPPDHDRRHQQGAVGRQDHRAPQRRPGARGWVILRPETPCPPMADCWSPHP